MALVVKHNADAGFFSCYTIRLLHILMYFNQTKTCPQKIDSSNLFYQYKINVNQDTTHEYIKAHESLDIEYTTPVRITDDDREDQFSNYKKINFQMIKPFIEKYFSPSDAILKRVSELETKYTIDYANLAVFYYRGTDKRIETNLCEYGAYIERAEQLKKDNPNIQHMGRSFEHSLWMLASVIVMSKAKYMVCSSGNVSLWIVLFRGHNNNIQQYLSPKEYIYGVKNKNYSNVEKTFWI